MKTLVFDMDGVLVDPRASYRQTLIETVRQFSGYEMTQERIVEIKNEGGYNDLLPNRPAGAGRAGRRGRDGGRITECFERLFWGADCDGLVMQDRWLVQDGALQRLRSQLPPGDLHRAAARGPRCSPSSASLRRSVFDPIMTSDDVENLKPAPDGLLKIQAMLPEAELIYVGDNIDDARCARAARACPLSASSQCMATSGRRSRALFRDEGALAVVGRVEEVENALEGLPAASPGVPAAPSR